MKLPASNRFALVPREHIHGTIEGVDFGYNLSCLSRSPNWVLLWSSGTAYTSGRQTCYGSSELYLLPHRNLSWRYRPEYKRMHGGGGRLSKALVNRVADSLVTAIRENDDYIAWLQEAVRTKQTLLVEGGGNPLIPHRKYGPAAFDAWASLPNKGLIQHD